MCIVPKSNPQQQQTVQQTVPSPEPTASASAEPTQIGSKRKEEDQNLFGGTPDLRIDRTTPPAVTGAGSGLYLA
jgi:hypothetical protein